MKTWPNIYKQGNGWIVDCGLMGGEKRVRAWRQTKTQADKLAAYYRERRDLERLGIEQLTPAERIDAANAMRLLRGTGITLEQLARKELDNGVKADILIGALWTEYIARKKERGLRPKSVRSIASREGRFAKDLEGVSLRDLTPEMIETWLSGCRVEPVTRNAYLGGVRTLLNYAVKQGYLPKNPADSIDFLITRLNMPTVFSVEQVRGILEWCRQNRPELVPYFAVGFFAGLRPDEIKRLTAAEVNLADRLITVTPEMSKTHMRHVKIHNNLHFWLSEYPVGDSCGWTRYWQTEMVNALKINWPADVCRKSFISYHLAAFRNQAETVQEAGHRDSTMIFTHYRNIKTLDGQLITSAYAADYWRILPEKG